MDQDDLAESGRLDDVLVRLRGVLERQLAADHRRKRAVLKPGAQPGRDHPQLVGRGVHKRHPGGSSRQAPSSWGDILRPGPGCRSRRRGPKTPKPQNPKTPKYIKYKFKEI